MMYRINKDYAKKFEKEPFEGSEFELYYKIFGRNNNGDHCAVRYGNAEDIDGIISILTEYGILEEVESEEDDEDEELPDDTVVWLNGISKTLNDLKYLNGRPLDCVCTRINGHMEYYLYPQSIWIAFKDEGCQRKTEQKLLESTLNFLKEKSSNPDLSEKDDADEDDEQLSDDTMVWLNSMKKKHLIFIINQLLPKSYIDQKMHNHLSYLLKNPHPNPDLSEKDDDEETLSEPLLHTIFLLEQFSREAINRYKEKKDTQEIIKMIKEFLVLYSRDTLSLLDKLKDPYD